MILLIGVLDGIVVRYGEWLMVVFPDGIELGTVDRIILEADDRINPGKILGVKLGFDLGMEIGIAVVIVDDIHLSDSSDVGWSDGDILLGEKVGTVLNISLGVIVGKKIVYN